MEYTQIPKDCREDYTANRDFGKWPIIGLPMDACSMGLYGESL